MTASTTLRQPQPEITMISLDHVKVGDYVRNSTSGKFGYVVEITADNARLKVLTIKRIYAWWDMKNVEHVKDAVR